MRMIRVLLALCFISTLTLAQGVTYTAGAIKPAGASTPSGSCPKRNAVLLDASTIYVCPESGTQTWTAIGSSGTGDVVGPSSATDNAAVRFDGTTGKLVQNSVVLIGDTGNITGVGSLSMSAGITSTVAGTVVSATGATTSSRNATFQNTGGSLYWGVEASGGANLFNGTLGYSAAFGTANATAVHVATNNNARTTWDSSGNMILGATAAGTSAAKVFGIANGTAPASSPADMVQLYAEDVTASSELKVRDEAGNITVLSPHHFREIPGGRSEEMAWSFYSERNGKYITVDMAKVIRLIEQLTGEKLIFIGEAVK